MYKFVYTNETRNFSRLCKIFAFPGFAATSWPSVRSTAITVQSYLSQNESIQIQAKTFNTITSSVVNESFHKLRKKFRVFKIFALQAWQRASNTACVN